MNYGRGGGRGRGMGRGFGRGDLTRVYVADPTIEAEREVGDQRPPAPRPQLTGERTVAPSTEQKTQSSNARNSAVDVEAITRVAQEAIRQHMVNALRQQL